MDIFDEGHEARVAINAERQELTAGKTIVNQLSQPPPPFIFFYLF